MNFPVLHGLDKTKVPGKNATFAAAWIPIEVRTYPKWRSCPVKTCATRTGDAPTVAWYRCTTPALFCGHRRSPPLLERETGTAKREGGGEGGYLSRATVGKRPLLAWCRNGDGWYKLLQIIENLSSYTKRFICDLLRMDAVERSYPRQLAGRLFYRLCLRSLCYRNKDASGASRDYGAVYQASTRPSTNVDTVVQPPSQNPGHRTNRG